MTPERYQRIQELFESALELDGDQRNSFLTHACADDDLLRQEVESLIKSNEAAQTFLESPAVQFAADVVTNRSLQLHANQQFGPYRVLSYLTAGGMGEVYVAEDTRLKRKVALKVLAASGAMSDERLRRFKQEALAVSAINHPNILTIYEVGSVDSIHFIATELVGGETMRQVLTRGAMPLGAVLNVAKQVVSALAAAHAAGVVHRDIKPENIMVRSDGYVKVLDFGIAKLKTINERQSDLNAATRLKTTPGMVLGTVSYMSPEQARGEDVDERGDIWSVGVLIYEMASGRLPFRGATMSHVLVSILDDAPSPLATVEGSFGDQFQRIVFRALAKERNERYQTASNLLQDLTNLEHEIQFQVKATQRLESSSPDSRSQPEKAATLPATPKNLPGQLTQFIGREQEVATITKLLTDRARLLTLTGPGGTGKTRLALQVAAGVLNNFKDGVIFVDLAAVTDPGLVASTIAQTVKVKEAPNASLLESLQTFLRDRHILLLLDNFEQVVDSAPLISELLNDSQYLKILVTSRAPLHINGEHEYAVTPLSVPAADEKAQMETVTRYPSVELFVERATTVKQDFRLTPENAETIGQICRRLEGLPLAIELAAARIKILPPKALLERLESRLTLLTSAARHLPSRQRTMSGAIAWSYDLLDEAEQKLFRRLSVFAGGCDLQAIESLCNAVGDLEDDMLEVVASLVDKSLLRQKETPDGDARFTMLETIAEFGREQLASSKETDLLRKIHADHFLKLAEEGETQLLGKQQEMWLDKFEMEHANLRAATQSAEDFKDTESALSLAGAMWRFWEMRGYIAEGREVLKRLLAIETRASTKARLKALYAAGVLADTQGDYESAKRFFEENLSLNRQLGDNWGVANSLNNLGIVALRQHDYERARSLYTKSLELWRELNNDRAVALALANLGNVGLLTQDYDAAEQWYRQSLELFQNLNDQRGVALSLHHLGDIARRQSNFTNARALYDQSLTKLVQVGDRRSTAQLLSDMAGMAAEQREFDEARRFHEEAMVIFSELGDVAGIAHLLEAIARVASARGDFGRALRLAAAAKSFRQHFDVPFSPHDWEIFEQLVATLRQKINASEVQIIWSEGSAMNAEQAIQYALAPPTV